MNAGSLVSRSEFARMCGVSAPAITKACKGPLSGAMVESLIDTSHPDAESYRAFKMSGKRTSPARRSATTKPKPKAKAGKQKSDASAKKQPKPRKKTQKPPEKPAKPAKSKQKPPIMELEPAEKAVKVGVDAIPDDIMEFADLPFRAVVSMFPTSVAMKNYVTSLRTMEQIETERIKNAEKKGILISRSLVEKCILDPIDAGNVSLLNAGSKRIAHKLHTEIKAGSTMVECEKFAKDILEQFLNPVKKKIMEGLSDGD